MIESVVGLTTHEMIISNASDEEMRDKKSLSMCKVAMGSFVIIKKIDKHCLDIFERYYLSVSGNHFKIFMEESIKVMLKLTLFGAIQCGKVLLEG